MHHDTKAPVTNQEATQSPDGPYVFSDEYVAAMDAIGIPREVAAGDATATLTELLACLCFDSEGDPVVGLLKAIERDLGLLITALHYDMAPPSTSVMIDTLFGIANRVTVAKSIHMRIIEAMPKARPESKTQSNGRAAR